MFELLLAYTFIGLFTGVVVFGHVLLIRDIFFASSPTRPSARPSATPNTGMRKAA